MKLINKYPLGILWTVFLLSVILVNPIGDFPINDDYIYAYPVHSLIENQNFDLIGLFSPNIFTQVIWGYLTCLIGGGFSFTLLRISTLLMAWFGLYFFYKILINLHTSKWTAFWSVLILWFNPLFFNLSFSFMTDVPFMTWCLATFYFYLLHQKHGDTKYKWIGHLLALATFMLRQPGLLLFLSYEVILFIYSKKDRKAMLSFLLAFMMVVGIYIGVEKGLKVSLGVEEHYLSVGNMYVTFFFKQPLFFVFQLFKRLFVSMIYMGIFTLPFAGFIWQKAKENNWTSPAKFLTVLVFNILIMLGFGYLNYSFPYSGNVMYNLGIGAILLPDTFSNWLTNWLSEKPELPFFILIIFGLICQMNATYLAAWMGQFFYKKIKNWKNLLQLSYPSQWFLLLMVFSTLYLLSTTVISFFDRYLLLPMTCLFIFLITKLEIKFFKKVSFYGVLFLFAFYSIAGTKDYLNILKTAHQAHTDLLEQGISAHQIDADMAVNGWHQVPLRNEKAVYKITMGVLPEHEEIATYPYFRWLHFKTDHIFILT